VALLGFAAVLLLSMLRIPIAFSMAVVGFAGLGFMRNWNSAVSAVTQTIFDTGFSYTLSVVPLFILMGNLVAGAGLSQKLYRAAYTFIGHWKGGLASSTIIACGGFGAICGSSIATTATMAKVAYPSMLRFNYQKHLAAGCIAAGGTLGILIPPSVIMVIYGLMTETNIGALFAAGILPGALAVALLIAAVRFVTWRNPEAGPAGPRTGWPERWRALGDIWGVVLLFAAVMGGIYGGVFTATEGASVGALGAFVFWLFLGERTIASLRRILAESARTTAMIFAIFIGALIFSAFVNFTTLPADLKAFVSQFQVHPVLVIAAICVIYVLLGTVMEELSMVLLTLPVFFPLVMHLGYDPVWFGVVVVVVIEIGLISPPVGMNMFVLHTLLPDMPLRTVFRGVWPFVAADCVRLAILVAFPAISLWLPKLLFQ
jgi:C4-dicarboxylate transporter, DctM subunit